MHHIFVNAHRISHTCHPSKLMTPEATFGVMQH